MKLGLSLELRYDPGISRRNLEMTNSDWARKLVSRIKNDREKKELDTKRMLEERTIKNTQGPKLWDAVKKSFQDCVALLNTELGEDLLIWEVVRSSEMRIRRKNTDMVLAGTYDQSGDEILFESRFLAGRTIKLKIQISSHGTVQLVTGNVPFIHDSNPQTIAENILSKFSTAADGE
jgi:hypothetical protein